MRGNAISKWFTAGLVGLLATAPQISSAAPKWGTSMRRLAKFGFGPRVRWRPRVIVGAHRIHEARSGEPSPPGYPLAPFVPWVLEGRDATSGLVDQDDLAR